MFIEIEVYNDSDYADGKASHTVGVRHALTPPARILINTQNIVSIEKNPNLLKGTYVGGPCVGNCDYFIRATSGDKFYIMKDEAARLLKIIRTKN